MNTDRISLQRVSNGERFGGIPGSGAWTGGAHGCEKLEGRGCARWSSGEAPCFRVLAIEEQINWCVATTQITALHTGLILHQLGTRRRIRRKGRQGSQGAP
jgi:hypothetical protein